jgi:hypothetical protein
MSLTFKYKDSYVISKPSEEDMTVWKDSLGSSYTGIKKALRIVVEATHSALINKNMRWYSPSKMRDGALTFINGNKPAKILKHHDTHSDPIGIVRGARFVTTVPQDLENNPDVRTLLSSTAEMKDQIKSMKRLIKSGVTSRPDWKGLGYIEVMADILDQDAIEKVSDGRFDAVSTSFNSPGHAYCFICGKNWAQDGMCEHTSIGEAYEDDSEEKWPMMLVPGLHLYEEMSMVVKDADPFTVIHISDEEMEKNIKYKINEEVADDNYNSAIKYEFRDSIEEDKNMPVPKQLEVEAPAALTSKEINDKVVEKVNAILASEENQEVKDDPRPILAEYDKLPDSSFCGPDRTFPVICAISADAALAVLELVEGLENKEEIKASITKKKDMFIACGEVVPAPASNDKEVSEEKLLTDEEAQAAFAKAEAELISRNLKVARECSKCADAHEELEKAMAQVVELKGKLADSHNTLAVLREELRFQQTDYIHQVDKFIELELKMRDIKEEKLAIVGTLVGKYKSIDIARESLKNEDMVTAETSIMDKFDMVKISEKLNDGMARVPTEGQINSPVDSTSKDIINIQNLEGPAVAVVDSIRDMVSEKRTLEAKKLYNKMIKIGVLPKELTFETVSAVKSNPAE